MKLTFNTTVIARLGLALASLALCAGEAAGAQQTPGEAPHTEPTVQANAMPVYVPPKRGAPLTTVGGGTRGARSTVPVLSVLAPDHVAQTVSAQPTLFWYLPVITNERVEFVLNDPRRTAPLFEKKVQPVAPGVQSMNLADLGMQLEPRVAYEWSVAVVPDPEHRSRDIVAVGAIERVVPSAELEAQLQATGKQSVASVYANAGIWYDTLMVLSDSIAATPHDPRPRLQRAALLEQVGLKEIAAAERKSATGN